MTDLWDQAKKDSENCDFSVPKPMDKGWCKASVICVENSTIDQKNEEEIILVTFFLIEQQKKLNLKLKLYSENDKTKKRSLTFFFKLDSLGKTGFFEKRVIPNANDLLSWAGMIVSVHVDVWSIDGKTGNFINGIQGVDVPIIKQPENFDKDLPF